MPACKIMIYNIVKQHFINYVWLLIGAHSHKNQWST